MKWIFKVSAFLVKTAVSGLIIKPLIIAVNLALLFLQYSILLMLYVSAIKDGTIFSLVKGWISNSIFQIRENLLSYLPEIVAMWVHQFLSFRLDKERLTHVHILGRSGSGKSTAMESFIHSDIKKGNRAIVLIEPHGELTERVLSYKLFDKEEHRKRLVVLDFESQELRPLISLR